MFGSQTKKPSPPPLPDPPTDPMAVLRAVRRQAKHRGDTARACVGQPQYRSRRREWLAAVDRMNDLQRQAEMRTGKNDVEADAPIERRSRRTNTAASEQATREQLRRQRGQCFDRVYGDARPRREVWGVVPPGPINPRAFIAVPE